MADIRRAFVLSELRQDNGSTMGWSRTVEVAEVTGPIDELRTRLRPWGLEVISSKRLENGRFLVDLVDLDDAGEFDLYFAEDTEEILWFYGKEYVPAS